MIIYIHWHRFTPNSAAFQQTQDRDLESTFAFQIINEDVSKHVIQ